MSAAVGGEGESQREQGENCRDNECADPPGPDKGWNREHGGQRFWSVVVFVVVYVFHCHRIGAFDSISG